MARIAHAGREATFVDRVGDTRIVRQVRPNRWQVRQPQGSSPSQSLSCAIGPIVGQKIRTRRIELGMTMPELAQRAGVVATTTRQAKSRIYEIENSTRGHGVKLGTLYAIAHALGCEPTDLLPTMEEAFGASNVRTVSNPVLTVVS